MRWLMKKTTTLALGLAVLMTYAALAPGIALAHSGHSHEAGGTRIDSVLQVAATASALVIAFVLATWFYRYRDKGVSREIEGGSDGPPEAVTLSEAKSPRAQRSDSTRRRSRR